MQTFELMIIINPNLSETDFKKTIDGVRTHIEKGKGKITQTDEWGNRKLAYPIKKHTHGHYLILAFQLQPKSMPALEKYLRGNESILRYLLTQTQTAKQVKKTQATKKTPEKKDK